MVINTGLRLCLRDSKYSSMYASLLCKVSLESKAWASSSCNAVSSSEVCRAKLKLLQTQLLDLFIAYFYASCILSLFLI